MKKAILSCILFCLTNLLFSQAGNIDTTFNPTDHGYGGEANAIVNTICLQPDGKIIIAGDFGIYNGVTRNRIARLNPDGSIDSTFNPGFGASTAIHSISLQADGKIIIGGTFGTYDGVVRGRIARLNTDGSLDTSFNPGTGISSLGTYATAVQNDGKILVGGEFTAFNGTLIRRIARLNSDGTLDSTFNPGGLGAGPPSINGMAESVLSINILPDGKILITGGFTTYNGVARSRIARLNADGTLDTTLNQVITSNYYIKTAAVLSNEKIIIGGGFNLYSNVNRYGIARINTDASLDTTFNPGSGITSYLTNDRINSILIQSDGKLIIAGSLQVYNGNPVSYIARINSDGSFDPTYDTGIGASSTITKAVQQADGKIIIVGSFTYYNNMHKVRITRLNQDGSHDNSFNTATGFDGSVWSASIQSDGKIVVGGSFTACNQTPIKNIVRMTADGSFDTSFNINGSGTNASVYSTSIQTDGKIIIAGDFTLYGLYTRNRIARLNVDGTVDLTFSSGLGPNFGIFDVYLQPDGKIIITGFFTTYNNVTRNRIARLNTNGSLDTTFDAGTGLNSNASIQAVGMQTDGKLIVVGGFTTFNGTACNRIVRLNPDGTLDPTFNTGIGANAGINSLHIQPDGKILLGGFFTSFNGTTTNCLIRLNADGTTDTSFYIETATTYYVINNILTQADGKIIINTASTIPFNNMLLFRLTRLNGNGSLDSTFNVAIRENSNSITTMAFQADEKLIIGGDFTSYDNIGRNRLARVLTAGEPNTIITTKLNIQGFYETAVHEMRPVIFNQGVSVSTTDVDVVTLELRNDSPPFAVAATTTTIVQTNGLATATFSPAITGSYYLAVKHRNAVQTWSALPITVNSATPTYDFTDMANKAYGSNMILMEPGVWAFYSGDLNQDEVIDGSDFPTIFNDIDASEFGNIPTDLNGDGSTDNLDLTFLFDNADLSIYSIHP